jgi:hypothetical protein
MKFDYKAKLPDLAAINSIDLQWRMLFSCCAISIVLVYVFLQSIYRPNNVDDGWSLSLLYNYVNNDIPTDLNFGDPLNGVQFFGKIHAVFVGLILNTLGWTRTNGHILSIVFMGIGLITWFSILRSLDYSIEFSLSFVLLSFLLDPFFTAATSTRLEAFEFLCISLAMAALLFRWYTVAMLIAWLAIESHPVGLITFFYLAALFFSSQSLLRSFIENKTSVTLKTLLGFLIGACGFYLFHHEAIVQLPSLLRQKNIPLDIKAYGPLYYYFFETKYYRHLPELALFLIAFFLFFKKGFYRRDNFTLIFMIFMAVGAVFMRRPNFHYTLFFYPVLLILLLRTSEAMGRLKVTFLFLLLFLLSQYLFVYINNHSFDFQKESQALIMTVPKDSRSVIGNGNCWFSFYNRSFYFYNYLGDFKKIGLREFYLIEDNEYRSMNGAMKKWIELHFVGKNVTTVIVNKQIIKIKEYRLSRTEIQS